LGAMLCNECYSLIGDLIHYVDNVNKVQPIFELLRHTEPSDQFDIRGLRHQRCIDYGTHLKKSHRRQWKQQSNQDPPQRQHHQQ